MIVQQCCLIARNILVPQVSTDRPNANGGSALYLTGKAEDAGSSLAGRKF